ncbi:phosphatase [Paraferrimonas haliotis]|uniref:Phosphatase n=2 Tax=Paraferrimonas haliotis TaxID=2013866 RepID=A0AA37U099_9GAMM|nr:phosphatase [Paraferrimonas haliotis]
MIDLHSHTRASDGGLTPSQLIMRASNRQLRVLAITDHDTTDGLAEAHQEVARLKANLKLINGVEISTRWHGFDIHIVALGVDIDNSSLQAFLQTQRQRRRLRAEKICHKLEKAGLTGALEGALAKANGAAISRSHIARWMVEKQHVSHMDAAFKKYLGKGQGAFVANDWHSIKEAIEVAHQAGGVCVLAHPSRYSMSTKWLRKLLIEFKQCGGDGMEVVLSQQGINERQLLLSLAHEYQLYCSLGSDFHYESQWVDLGRNLFLADNAQWIWQSPRWREEL